MLNKIWLLGIVSLAFVTTVSVAEAKVCFAVAQEDCGITVVSRAEEPSGGVSKCSARFSLTEVMQPADDNHICNCDSCEDDDGMHYACSCKAKEPVKKTCEMMGMQREKPEIEKGVQYTCTKVTDDFGDICYSCEEVKPDTGKCPVYYNLTEILRPADDNHVCSCDSCSDDDGMHYACSCRAKPEPIKETCEMKGMLREKPEAEEGMEYTCTETTDDYGDTCYSCKKQCLKTKECAVCTEIYNETTCKCDPVTEDCANLCFKFIFTDYVPLSKDECESVKDEYGIQYCIDAEKDYFAGAVKACGGIDEIPTEDEAFKLGQCMYDPNETFSTIYGGRYDGYFISYGGSGSDLADHVYVWLNWERDKADHNAIIRMYDYYGTIPYYANKDGSLYYESYGAIPRVWYNDSILSRTLCRAH